MLCPACNASISDTSKECSSCGLALESEPPSLGDESEHTMNPASNKPQRMRKPLARAFLALAILSLLVIALLAWNILPALLPTDVAGVQRTPCGSNATIKGTVTKINDPVDPNHEIGMFSLTRFYTLEDAAGKSIMISLREGVAFPVVGKPLKAGGMVMCTNGFVYGMTELIRSE